jgi:carbon-monoxide dehydrogenase large subunit
MIVEGQVHGGVAQGIGGALHEAMVYGADGQPLTTTLLDYALPSAVEVPSIVVEHLVHPSPRIPGGMKGMAEGGVIPTAAAIANAVAAAVPRIATRLTETPLDPHRMWRLLSGVDVGEGITVVGGEARPPAAAGEHR